MSGLNTATPMHPFSQSGSISPYTLELAQIELQNPLGPRRLRIRISKVTETPPIAFKKPYQKNISQKITYVLDFLKHFTKQ